MTSHYKLRYFDYMGVGEPIRLILASANVDFEDVRHAFEEWPTLKDTTPWGQMPMLEVEGHTIAQSVAISRFLARRLKLTGDTEFDSAECDQYIDALRDTMQDLRSFKLEGDEQKKQEGQKKFEEETLPLYFQRFSKALDKNGSGFLVGKRLTYADIYLAYFIEFWGSLASTAALDKFPLLTKHHDMIMSQPGIKEWVTKRPSTQRYTLI